MTHGGGPGILGTTLISSLPWPACCASPSCWSPHLHRLMGLRLGPFGVAQRRPGERQAVGVVHEPIEDSVGERWLIDDVVPLVHRQLAGDQGRPRP